MAGRTPQGNRVGSTKVWMTFLHTADHRATREATRTAESTHRKGAWCEEGAARQAQRAESQRRGKGCGNMAVIQSGRTCGVEEGWVEQCGEAEVCQRPKE